MVNLDDHEPEKIEWLLRFIYHQDLKWHRDYAISKSRNGFLAMLVELTILGDYFLTQGLIDAASEAAVDVCSSFGVKCWALDFHDDIDDAGDLYFPDTPTKSFKAFIHDLMEAIALTSKTSGPTCQFREFFVKFMTHSFGLIRGLSTWGVKHSKEETEFWLKMVSHLRHEVVGVLGPEDEMKATLFDTVFPASLESVIHPLFYVGYEMECQFSDHNPFRSCDGCQAIVLNPIVASNGHLWCLSCAKAGSKNAWSKVMLAGQTPRQGQTEKEKVEEKKTRKRRQGRKK